MQFAAISRRLRHLNRTYKLVAVLAAAAVLVAVGTVSATTDTHAAATGNLLTNPSFETDLAGWSSWQGSLDRVPDLAAPDGDYVALVSSRGGSRYAADSDPTRIRATGTGERFSAHVQVAEGSTSTNGRPVQLFLRETRPDGGWVTDRASAAAALAPGFRTLSVTLDAEAAGDRIDLYVIQSNARPGDSFRLDAAQLDRTGTSATTAPIAISVPAPGRTPSVTRSPSHIRPRTPTRTPVATSPSTASKAARPTHTPSRPGTAATARTTSADATTRGIYRFASTDWPRFSHDGFNASTDGGLDHGAAERAAGLTGMVWVDAYDNTSCKQTMTDAQVAALVRANVSAGSRGLVYQIGDEPTVNGCDAAPVYRHLTAVVHAADPSAKTWVVDDQFNDPSTQNWPKGVPMKGTVDILAFDIYPCMSDGKACHLDMIDKAVTRIHSEGITDWQFVMQDFGSYSSWRWPSPAEITAQFAHWRNAGASGYWVFAWDYSGGSLTSRAGSEAALRSINSLTLNGG